MKFLTTSFLWILAILASANDGVYYVSGNQIVPLQETDVAVTKEVLTISIQDDGFARVDVQYEFTNRGKPRKWWMWVLRHRHLTIRATSWIRWVNILTFTTSPLR